MFLKPLSLWKNKIVLIFIPIVNHQILSTASTITSGNLSIKEVSDTVQQRNLLKRTVLPAPSFCCYYYKCTLFRWGSLERGGGGALREERILFCSFQMTSSKLGSQLNTGEEHKGDQCCKFVTQSVKIPTGMLIFPVLPAHTHTSIIL